MKFQSIIIGMARSEKLNQKMKDERREEILQNALAVFASKGFAGAKITDISARSGFSQGLIYHYYKSKEEIFTELISTSFDKLNEAAKILEKMPLPPEAKISMALKKLISDMEDDDNRSKLHLLIAQASLSESIPAETKKVIREKNRLPYEVIARIISLGQIEGTIRDGDPDQLATLFWTSLIGLAINRSVHPDHYKKADTDILLRMFIK